MRIQPPQIQKEANRFSGYENRKSTVSSSTKLQKITPKNLRTAFNSVYTTDISKESSDLLAISDISDANHIEDNSDIITKKDLHSAFHSVSDKTTAISKESVDFLAISEISVPNHVEETSNTHLLQGCSSQNFLDSVLSPKLITGSDFKLTSKVNSENEKILSSCNDSFDSCHSKDIHVEAKVAAGLLRDAQSEIRKSTDISSKYKKVLNRLIDTTVQEFHDLPMEKDHFAEFLYMKTQVLFVFLLVCLVVVLILCSDKGRSYIGPLPT